MKNRISEYLSHLGMEQTKFEEKVGLPKGFVNTLEGNMPTEALRKITETFPNLNEEWLTTGKGRMLKNSQQVESVFDSSVVGVNVEGDNNQIIYNDLSKAAIMQDGFLSILKVKDEQINNLKAIINNLNNHGK